MMNVCKRYFSSLASIFGFVLLVPRVARAAPQDLSGLIALLVSPLNAIVGLLSGVALLAFIWGIVKYIANAGDSTKAKEGRKVMVAGVLGLFVLFSIWGILRLLITQFGIDTTPL